jgi:hypothetical protein
MAFIEWAQRLFEQIANHLWIGDGLDVEVEFETSEL